MRFMRYAFYGYVFYGYVFYAFYTLQRFNKKG